MKLKKSAFVILTLVLIDQIVKICINNYFNELGNGDIVIIPNFFELTFVKNFGTSFNGLNGMFYVIIVVVICATLFLMYLLNKFKEDRTLNICISFMIAGALGNLIDRFIHGYVIDYIHFDLGFYDFPVFNLADMFLVCSLVYMMLHVYIIKKDKYDNKS